MSENQSGDCPEEKIKHGDFGTVKDNEFLARFVLLGNKHFVDMDNYILPGALNKDDFLKGDDGWSFSRQEYVSNMAEELERHASQSGRRGKDYGYASVRVGDIRQILDEAQKRVICIIDDPREDNLAHALAKRARKYDKDEIREIRKNLLKKFSKVITP